MKMKEFLDQTSEMRNGDRITIVVCTTILTGLALTLNQKLTKSKISGIYKDMEILALKTKLEELGNKSESKDE